MKTENIANLIIFIFIYAFLFSYFKPTLLFSQTLTNGGDTGSHISPFFYMRDYLLPNFKIVGWYQGWYAGIPIFHFYFPLVYALMSFISYIIPATISFKIGTVLGTFLLPLTTFLAMKIFGFKFPLPILSSLITLLLLFNEGNSMWGLNIPSTLAGEFSESFSFSLMILFFPLSYLSMKEKKFLIPSSILFTLILLSHVITAIVAFLSSLFLLFIGNPKEIFKRLFLIYFLSFLLSSFWFLPLIFKLKYATPFFVKWYFSDFRKEMFPNIFLPFLFLSIFGIFLSIKKKEKRILYLLFPILPSILLFYLSPFLGIVDIRFLPFIQFFLLLPSSYFLCFLFSHFKSGGKFALLIITSILILIWVKSNITYIGSWIEWNYSGYENKKLWNVYSSINNFLKQNSNARVVYEHTSLNEELGTVRAFENLPLLSGRPTLEGLFFQSIETVPFVFYIQSLITPTPSCPFPEWQCTSFNLTKAWKYLKLFNVEHFIVRSDEVKKEIRNNNLYELAANFTPYEIYRVKGNEGKYVYVPKYFPVYLKTENWRKTFYYDWFPKEELLDIPLVIEKDNFPEAKSIEELPKIEVDNNCKIEENVSNEEIKFLTNCTGKPHIIRISYFPNWKVEGAEKIYLVSPSFMLVFPNRSYVRIYYSQTLIDKVGAISSVFGIVLITILLVKNSKRGKFFLKNLQKKLKIL
jgi:hypothetical protein